MRKKFRTWRGIIPRVSGTRLRIRNPWAMITLGWEPTIGSTNSSGILPVGINNRKAVIHDVAVKYTI